MTSLRLVGCEVVDVLRGDIWHSANIEIRDGAIVEVATGSCSSTASGRRNDAMVIDLEGRHVAPGLINMHVHLSLALPGGERERLADEGDAGLALRMAANARRTLEAGVTTVRCVGEPRGVEFALRRAAADGDAVLPRIFSAGTLLCCTGGHGNRHGTEADGPDAFARAARLQIKRGADLLKIAISGGISGVHETIATSQMNEAEVGAVTQVAHAWGRKVAAHVGPVDGIRLAIEHGVDSIEHGYELDEETAALMSERGTWYVPTIVVSRCREYFERIRIPDWMMRRALSAGERHFAALKNALAAGVQIAMGSDMLPFEPYEGTTASVRELEFYGEAGMDPVEVLRSATIRPASWLGRQGELGAVEPGYRADLVVLHGNPLEAPSELRGIGAVLHDGQLVRDDEGMFRPWRRKSNDSGQ